MVKRNLLLFIITFGLISSGVTAYAVGENKENDISVIGSEETINNNEQDNNPDDSNVDDNQPSGEDTTSTEPPATTEEPQEPQVEIPPVVQPNLNSDGLVIDTTYEVDLPDNMIIDLGYKNHPVFMKYFLVRNSRVNIRQLPNIQSPVVTTSSRNSKIRIVETVQGQQMTKSNLWHKVEYYKKGEARYGYVYSGLGYVREFQFRKMVETISKLKGDVDSATTAYISNYKNYNGLAPKINDGKVVDEFGKERTQSAPAYVLPNRKSKARYLGDGHLVSVIGQADGYYNVKSLTTNEEYWVPKKYVTHRNSIKELKQVVVVDVTNQNEAVFSYIGDNKWQLQSFVYATTGAQAKHKEPTEIGNFMAIQKKDKFIYLDDETKEIDGYAPYATRFNGGAYIHGVPVAYIKEPIIKEEDLATNTEDSAEVKTDVVATEEEEVEYKLIDPGKVEAISSLGTVPLSHKCVRNFTSHAKFLYEWLNIGSSAITVID